MVRMCIGSRERERPEDPPPLEPDGEGRSRDPLIAFCERCGTFDVTPPDASFQKLHGDGGGADLYQFFKCVVRHVRRLQRLDLI